MKTDPTFTRIAAANPCSPPAAEFDETLFQRIVALARERRRGPRRRVVVAVVCAAALLLPGCSPKAPPPIVPVEGVVLLGGQALPHAQVSFVPMVADLGFEYVAVGTTDEKGRFQLTCKGQAGACAGAP